MQQEEKTVEQLDIRLTNILLKCDCPQRQNEQQEIWGNIQNILKWNAI